MALLTRLHNLWRGPALERELDEELRFHFEMRVDRNVRRGMDRREAEAEARRHMGSALRAREAMHEARVVPSLESIARDLAQGVRMLRRHPAFTGIAVLTMALGIGANAAIFSVLQAVWIDAVPFRDPARLAIIQQYFGSWQEFTDLRAQSRSFVDMVPFQRRAEMLQGEEGTRVVGAIGTTDSLFTLLGITPALGRALTPDDLRAGAPPVALLSHGFWQENYGGDTAVIGRALWLRPVGGLVGSERPDRLHTIVGVMPPGVRLMAFEPSLWLPVPLEDRESSEGRGIDEIVARLRPGVSIESARRDVVPLVARLETGRPRLEGARFAMSLVGLREQVVGAGIGRSLFLLLGATIIVLLIACANVANLFLARGLDRARETAIRAAVGAGKARLVRQSLIENALVAFTGCAVGVGLAAVARDALVASMPYNVPHTQEIAIDWRVLLFSMGVTTCTILLTGLVPALRDVSARPEAVLTASGSQSRVTPRRHLGYGLVAAEVALSVVLLAAAALLVGSFLKLTAIHPGFDPTNVASFRADPPSASERLPAATATRLLEDLARAPDVVAAAITDTIPLGIGAAGRAVGIPGQERVMSALRAVTPRYFDVMRIERHAGRDFLASDDADAQPVAIVNERAARRFWPGAAAVGQKLDVFGPVPALVVGVVNDVRYSALSREPDIEVYVPQGQYMSGSGSIRNVVVRTTGNPVAVVQRLESRIREVTGNPVALLTALDTYVERSTHMSRFRALLFGLLGLLAIVLAATGVFGVTAHVVARRRRELGIRLAIGARPSDVVTMTVAQTALPVLGGAALGLLGALAATKLVAQFLYATTPTDPATFALVLGAVMITSLAAAWLPARRTRRIDPVEVLRLD